MRTASVCHEIRSFPTHINPKILDQTSDLSEKPAPGRMQDGNGKEAARKNQQKQIIRTIYQRRALNGDANLVRRMQTTAESTGADKEAVPVKMKLTQPRIQTHSSAP